MSSQHHITGLHHVTTVAGNPQKNIDFYAGILGLRFIKQTVNFDSPDVYHLYYGDYEGNPGTIMTSFPFGDIHQGKRGAGQATATQFSASASSIDYWAERLQRFGILSTRSTRFGEEVLSFVDYDGLGLEITGTDADKRAGYHGELVEHEHSLKGFYGITLNVATDSPTLRLLTDYMNHTVTHQENGRTRLRAATDSGVEYIDLVEDRTQRGLGGNGTVHHIAFRTPDDESQEEIREILLSVGYHPTPIIDRQYFHSIYFREPNGILFEIATNPPGFTTDEAIELLGTELQLPAWHEPKRQMIQQLLEPITTKHLTNDYR
ncbi:MAG: ring-cleaving dioxygenase [Candidatus Kapabacteria bacterium]|nr:ring-cleaving dioxygenase [Candidatus Kapabacteria bacterium]